MKYLKYFLTLVISILFININVYAIDNYQTTINMEQEITDDCISIIVGFKGSNIMAITSSIEYNNKDLSLVGVTPLEDFVITKSNEHIKGKKTTINTLADTNSFYYDNNYMVLIFAVSEDFKIGEKSIIKIKNFEAASSQKTLFTSPGVELTLEHDSKSTMLYLINDISFFNTVKRIVQDNVIIFIILAIAIIAAVLILTVLRTSKKDAENFREEMMREAVKGQGNTSTNNYQFSQQPTINGEPKFIDNSLIDETKPVIEQIPTQVFNQQTKVQDGVVIVTEQPVQSSAQPVDKPNDTEIVELDDKPNDTEIIELDTKNDEDDEIIDLDNQLVQFQPTNFDNNKVENNDRDKPELFSIVLILLITSFALITNASASAYKVNELRDAIVGNIPYSDTYDYNHDGKLSVLDMLETKNTTPNE